MKSAGGLAHVMEHRSPWYRDRSPHRVEPRSYRERLILLHEALAAELVSALRRKQRDRSSLEISAKLAAARFLSPDAPAADEGQVEPEFAAWPLPMTPSRFGQGTQTVSSRY